MDFQKELVAEYDRETASTRKILEAIPEDADFAWKPHAKSYALGPSCCPCKRHRQEIGPFTPSLWTGSIGHPT